MKVEHANFHCYFAAVYSNSNPSLRMDLWNQIRQLSSSINDWLFVGDFNTMLKPENKRGGRPLSHLATKDFNQCIMDCNLVELESRGPIFTWEQSGVLEKLDWALVNMEWKLKFPESLVDHHPKLKSDHKPLLIKPSLSSNHRQSRPFRFQSAWLWDSRFLNFVKSTWDDQPSFLVALDNFSSFVIEWNKTHFGNIFLKKLKLLRRIQGLQRALESHPTSYLRDLEKALQSDLEMVLL